MSTVEQSPEGQFRREGAEIMGGQKKTQAALSRERMALRRFRTGTLSLFDNHAHNHTALGMPSLTRFIGFIKCRIYDLQVHSG